MPVKKFSELTIFKNRHQFEDMRNWIDAYLLFSIIKNFQPTSVLEIGFFQGFTFGLMFETASDNCKFLSNDITYKNNLLFQYIKKPDRVVLEEKPSTELILQDYFDFIVIDGLHEYHPVIDELSMCYNQLTDDGIILLDDFVLYPQVNDALLDFIKYNKLYPIIIGHQQMFLSKSNNHTSFVNKIRLDTSRVVNWTTTEWQQELDVPLYQAKHVKFVSKFPEVIELIEKDFII